eukprot:14102459-Ditylum_brightwellii.AAC.3
MGRWSYVVMKGKSKKVYIVLAKRVALEKNDGIQTAYTQQYIIIQEKGIEQPHLRKQWCTGMIHQIKEWRKEVEILLLTDANLELGDTEFGDFVAEAGLYDILGFHHGIGKINSHINGTKRIDFAIGTVDLVRTIRYSWMQLFHTEIVSDHGGIFLDIDEHHLF